MYTARVVISALLASFRTGLRCSFLVPEKRRREEVRDSPGHQEEVLRPVLTVLTKSREKELKRCPK